MASYERCLAEITQAVGRELSVEEAKRLDKQVTKLIDKLSIDRHAEAFDSLLQAEIAAAAEQAEVAALVQKRNAVKNLVAKVKQRDGLAEWSDQYAEGLQAKLGGSMTGKRGAKLATSSAQEALANTYQMGWVSDLDAAGVTKVFATGEYDEAVYVATHELAKKTPDAARLAQLPKEAVAIAKINEKWNEVARLNANKAGAWIDKIPGYVTKQSHDAEKIRPAGSDQWVAHLVDALDWERTFPDVEPATRVKMLQNMWGNLASNRHISFSDAPTTGFQGHANIGKKLSHERVLHFKSPEAEYAYQQAYGRGTLRESMFYGLGKMGRDTALMRDWGPNAFANYTEVVNDVLARLTTAGDMKQKIAVSQKDTYLRRVLWPFLTGEINAPEHATFARYSAIVRGIQAMADLGGAMLSSITDIPVLATAARQQGVNMFRGIAQAMGSVFSSVATGERAKVLSETGVLIDSMRIVSGDRWDVGAGKTGSMAKAMHAYFKLNLLSPWTDRLRGGFVLATAHRLANHSDRAFGELPTGMQHLLQQYGIGDAEWGIIRQAKESHADGKAFLTPEGIGDLPTTATFKTAKGSSYTVESGSRTTRNKAPRPEHPGDQGLKPTSEITIFVDKAGLDALSEVTTTGGAKRKIARLADGRYGVQYVEGKDAGKFEQRTVVSPKVDPAVGLYPVELWKGGKEYHFGNKITEVSKPVVTDTLKTELQTKLRTFFQDQSITAVVEPSTMTRAQLIAGHRPGTATGEAMRHFWMYKSFTMSIMRQVMGRELFGYGQTRGTIAGALFDMVKHPTGSSMVGMANMIAFTTVFGYAAMVLKDLAKGKEPRQPEEPADTARLLGQAMAQGGGLGIYGDFLFGEATNRFGHGPLESFLGPTWKRLSDLKGLYNAVVQGDDPSAKAITTMFNSTPFINLFYTRWALDYLVTYRLQEMMNPGYLRRMEQRLRDEKQQEFVLPPSTMIPYGGN